MSNEQSTEREPTARAVGEREIHTERVFDASRDRVWAAHTDPELVAQWWGPRKYAVVVEELDARTGGAWRILHRDDEGNEHLFRGIYREVTPRERIAQTFEWGGMPGYVSLETATFEDLGDGRTKISTVSVFYASEERDGMLSSGMEEGMNETYDRLDEMLAA